MKDKPYKVRVTIYADVIGWGKTEEEAMEAVTSLSSTGDFDIQELGVLNEIKKKDLEKERIYLESSRHEYKYVD